MVVVKVLVRLLGRIIMKGSPAIMLLHEPLSVFLSTSKSQTADRLYVEWSLPSLDRAGFNTDLSTCGSSIGHTPDIALSYVIQWDTNPSMSSSVSYEASMENNGILSTCCSNDKCAIEIGTEIQSISVNSNVDRSLTATSFKVMYVGPQSHSAQVAVKYGSKELKVTAYNGLSRIRPLVFARIKNIVYRVSHVIDQKVVLTVPYSGQASDVEVICYFNTPPSSCFDAAGSINGSEDLKNHVLLNFDQSPFDESITVSKKYFSSFEEEHGSTYYITFTRPFFFHTAISYIQERTLEG